MSAKLSDKIGQLKIEVYEEIVQLTIIVAEGMRHFVSSDKTARRCQA